MTLRNKESNKKKLWIGVGILAFLPIVVSAQDISTLINIPQLSGEDGFNGYINAVYAICISIAALLAVVKIIVAGVKYMFSDIITHKSEAKKDIRSALFGLVIILGAVLILNLINPNLTQFNIDGIYSLPTAPTGGGSTGDTVSDICSTNPRCTVVACTTDCQDEIEECNSEEGRIGQILRNDRIACVGSPTLYENLCGVDGSRCVNTACRFFRFGTCADACQTDGGYFHESGGIGYGLLSGSFDSCSIPIVDREIAYIPCARVSTESGPAYDCTVPATGESLSAFDICTENGANDNIAYEVTNENFIDQSTPQIACVENAATAIPTLSCTSLGRGSFDCTSATNACSTGGGIPSPVEERDDIINCL